MPSRPISAALAPHHLFRGARRGFFLRLASATNAVNDFGRWVAVSGLVGMFSKQAIAKLDELFTTMFRNGPSWKSSLTSWATRLPTLTVIKSVKPLCMGAGDTTLVAGRAMVSCRNRR